MQNNKIMNNTTKLISGILIACLLLLAIIAVMFLGLRTSSVAHGAEMPSVDSKNLAIDTFELLESSQSKLYCKDRLLDNVTSLTSNDIEYIIMLSRLLEEQNPNICEDLADSILRSEMYRLVANPQANVVTPFSDGLPFGIPNWEVVAVMVRHPFSIGRVQDAGDFATATAVRFFYYPGHRYVQFLGNGDAVRHGLWNAKMIRTLDYNRAEAFATAWEAHDSGQSKVMDLVNNAIGRQHGLRHIHLNDEQLALQILRYVSEGRYYIIPCRDYTNGQLKPSNWDYIQTQYKFRHAVSNNSVTINGLSFTPPVGIVLHIPERINGRNVTEIGPSAFANQQNLSTITLPSTVIHVSSNAFGIGAAINWLGNFNFTTTNCNVGLAFSRTTVVGFITPLNFGGTVNVPEGVTALGPAAFQNQHYVMDITVPSTVDTIWDYAFLGAVNLRTVRISNPIPPIINGTTFANVNRANVDVIIPTGRTQAYINAGWSGFNIVEPASENTPLTLRPNGLALLRMRQPGLSILSSGNANVQIAGIYTMVNNNLTPHRFPGVFGDFVPVNEFQGFFSDDYYYVRIVNTVSIVVNTTFSIHRNFAFFAMAANQNSVQ